MPTHTYGQLAEYGRTRQLAAERGWFVLENDSLAATISPERRFRAFGDALLSVSDPARRSTREAEAQFSRMTKLSHRLWLAVRRNGQSLTTPTMRWRTTLCSRDDTFMP